MKPRVPTVELWCISLFIFSCLSCWVHTKMSLRSLRLCLIPENLSEKKGVGMGNIMKEKMKEKKIELNLIYYFYLLPQINFIYCNSSI